MPSTSRKGNQMPPSPIRKLVPFAEKAKKGGKKIYHLNIGQPDIETPEVMLKAIHNYPNKIIEYSHSAGIESYRRKLLLYYKKFDINIDFTDIIITTGGSEAIAIAMMSCFDPGRLCRGSRSCSGFSSGILQRMGQRSFGPSFMDLKACRDTRAT